MPDAHTVVLAPGRVSLSDVLGRAAPHPAWIISAPAGGAPRGWRVTDGLRRPAPGRLCCCVLDPYADLELDDVWPRWARAPDVGLVVVTAGDPVAPTRRPERAGLLACADVIVRVEDPEPPDAAPRLLAGITRACARAVATRRATPVPTPRIAVSTPWPPDHAGPAASMQRLVDAVPPQVHVDVVAHDDVTTFYPHATEVEAWSATVCSIGDSRFHIPAWQALMRHRADVLLHDARISGLYEALLRQRVISPAEYRDTLLRLEAQRLPAAMRADPPAPVDGWDALRLGLMFVGDVIDRAGRILVHSTAARDLVVAERPDRAADVHVIVHGGPPVQPDLAPRSANLVVALGHPRAAELTLQAFARAHRRHPGVRLLFVGEAGAPSVRRRLVGLAAELGIGTAVTFTGWVDDATWRAHAAAATVALQLRGFDRGESSATIAYCMATGVPVVTTAVGAVAELPGDAVVRLPADAGADTIGDALASLLDDPARRDALAAAGRAYQRDRQPADAARALVRAVCDALPGPAGATRRGTS